MFYEVFEEIRNGKVTTQQLVNKSYLDSIYRPKSQINDIYNPANDRAVMLENSYPYIIYQKILMGISSAIFFGTDPWKWNCDIFNPNGRINVPDVPLNLYPEYPCLIFDQENFSYQGSNFYIWETELQKISPYLKKITGVEITSDGFKAHTYRILENLMGLRSVLPKRSGWVEFLHDLMILDKKFTREELAQRFKLSILPDNKTLVEDVGFISKDYLEFNLMKKLGAINTLPDSGLVLEGADAFQDYSKLNNWLMGKLPLSHFYVGQHMFIGKEELDLNSYYDFFIKPWEARAETTIHYFENPTGEMKSSLLPEFANHLKKVNYIIVSGLTEEGRGTLDAQPRMLKG